MLSSEEVTSDTEVARDSGCLLLAGEKYYRWNEDSGAWVIVYDRTKIKESDTQKVVGVKLLNRFVGEYGCYALPWSLVAPETYDLASFVEDRRKLKDTFIFARPCPKFPRHGFIESRPVQVVRRRTTSVVKDLFALRDEVLSVDKDGQLLVMPYVRAAYNTVLANSSVTVGAYHDGATANRKAIVIPTAPIELPESTKIAARIKNEPFVEAVTQKNEYGGCSTFITQLRDGPKTFSSRDYIPKTFVVRSVFEITHDEDMLAFAESVKNFAPDTAVYCRDGGINSHAGIHCTLHGVPFITSHRPTVGERLCHTNKSKKWPCDRSAFASGVDLAIRSHQLPLSGESMGHSTEKVTRLLLFVLHSYPFFNFDREHQSRLLGAACGFAVRLGMVACLGESRYFNVDAAKREASQVERKVSRTAYYKNCLEMGFDDMVEEFLARTVVFGWKGGGDGSIGGPNWHNCSIKVAQLWNAVVVYIYGHVESETSCVEALNAVVNVSHNGSFLLTKFATKEHFTRASSTALPYTALPIVNWLYRCAFDRIPKSKVPYTVAQLPLSVLWPTKDNVIWRNEIPFAYEEYFTLTEKREMLDEFEEKKAAKTKRYKGIIPPWPTTKGCDNCSNSPHKGSYLSNDAYLQPCCVCNADIYDARKWKLFPLTASE